MVTELTQSLSPQCPYILVLWPSFLLFLLIQFLVNLCNCSCLNRVHVTRVCVHVCTEAHFWVGEWLFIWRACKGDVQYLRSETVMLAMLWALVWKTSNYVLWKWGHYYSRHVNVVFPLLGTISVEILKVCNFIFVFMFHFNTSQSDSVFRHYFLNWFCRLIWLFLHLPFPPYTATVQFFWQ